MLLAEKSSEIFPEQNRYLFISGSFALKWYMFLALANKKLVLPLSCRLKQNVLSDLEKVIEYLVSAVNVVSSNPCVGPIPRIN